MSFDAAIARVASFGPTVKVSDDDKLQLYALFKQTRIGDANDKDAPSYFNVVQNAKFQAWKKLHGVSQEEAEKRYVKLVLHLDPSWTEELEQQLKLEHFRKKKKVEFDMNHSVNGFSKDEMNGHSTPSTPVRRYSLDQNFVFNLKPNTEARFSDTLQKVLTASSSSSSSTQPPPTTRPRGRSLDYSSNFVVTPWIPIEAMGETVKKLALKSDKRIIDHLKGVGNARELGGLPALTSKGLPGRIRPNLLIRCAQLGEATEEDKDWFIKDFGLRTVLDFRSAASQLTGPLSEHFDSTVCVEHDDHVKQLISNTTNTSTKKESGRVRISLPLINRDIIRRMSFSTSNILKRVYMIVLKLLETYFHFLRNLVAAVPILARFSWIFEKLEKFFELRLLFTFRSAFVNAGLKSLYIHILLHGQNVLKSALDIVSEPAFHPLAFHCSFGKDRTGIVAALLLHACGVSREDILKDFALSHTFVDTERGRKEWEMNIVEMPELRLHKDEWARSPAGYLDEALKVVEKKYGSIDNYLKSVLKYDDTWVRKVRDYFVEEIRF